MATIHTWQYAIPHPHPLSIYPSLSGNAALYIYDTMLYTNMSKILTHMHPQTFRFKLNSRLCSRAFIMSHGDGLSERLLAMEVRMTAMESWMERQYEHSMQMERQYQAVQVVLGVDPQSFQEENPLPSVWGKFMRLEVVVRALAKRIARACDHASAFMMDERHAVEDIHNEFVGSTEGYNAWRR